MIRFFFLLFLLPTIVFAQTTRPTAADHVLIISIDGCRPDLLLRAKTPNVHHLYEDGTFTFWAKTTALSTTIPSHISMLTGVSPRVHGIEWNLDLPLKQPVFPRVPTLFEIAHHAGYTTALVAGKSKFDLLAKPGTLDWLYLPKTQHDADPDGAREAVAIIREHKPNVMFVHFADCDSVGHAKGWGTPEQIAAVEGADVCVGQILAALDEANLADRTTIILTADHGGAGMTHFPDDARCRTIPWIIHGPGIRKNLDLSRWGEWNVNTEDTFATACYLLGLHMGPLTEGKPVKQAFEVNELIMTTVRPDRS
jgi:predicted AlkP superfamily pyrophosphatase or phosphodiesterase